jgi:hypothetical protein
MTGPANREDRILARRADIEQIAEALFIENA